MLCAPKLPLKLHALEVMQLTAGSQHLHELPPCKCSCRSVPELQDVDKHEAAAQERQQRELAERNAVRAPARALAAMLLSRGWRIGRPQITIGEPAHMSVLNFQPVPCLRGSAVLQQTLQKAFCPTADWAPLPCSQAHESRSWTLMVWCGR